MTVLGGDRWDQSGIYISNPSLFDKKLNRFLRAAVAALMRRDIRNVVPALAKFLYFKGTGKMYQVTRGEG